MAGAAAEGVSSCCGAASGWCVEPLAEQVLTASSIVLKTTAVRDRPTTQIIAVLLPLPLLLMMMLLMLQMLESACAESPAMAAIKFRCCTYKCLVNGLASKKCIELDAQVFASDATESVGLITAFTGPVNKHLCHCGALRCCISAGDLVAATHPAYSKSGHGCHHLAHHTMPLRCL